MKNIALVLMTSFLMAASCEHAVPEEGVRRDKPLATELKKTQETITLDGKTLTLTANLWRDFMPSIGKADNSMQATVKVACENKIPLPEDLKIVRLMTVMGDSVWVTNVQESDKFNQQALQAGAKGGPEWEVGATADVIVELDVGERTYYLRKQNVRIEATH